MARRRLLTDAQLAPFWSWAADERGIVQHYALTPADLELVDKKRAGANRLGFALLLCAMRFPGRILDVGETPPAEVLAFVAEQVAVPASELGAYRSRSTNRREHATELMHSLGRRAFDKDPARELSAVAVSLAQGMPRLERLVAAVIEEARKRRILLPTPRAMRPFAKSPRPSLTPSPSRRRWRPSPSSRRLDTLKTMYQTGQRTLPAKPPLRGAWRRLRV